MFFFRISFHNLMDINFDVMLHGHFHLTSSNNTCHYITSHMYWTYKISHLSRDLRRNHDKNAQGDPLLKSLCVSYLEIKSPFGRYDVNYNEVSPYFVSSNAWCNASDALAHMSGLCVLRKSANIWRFSAPIWSTMTLCFIDLSIILTCSGILL